MRRLRQVCSGEQPLHHVLVHPGGRTQNTRANVSHIGQLEQALDGAIFPKRPVQDGKDEIDAERVGVGLRGRECGVGAG